MYESPLDTVRGLLDPEWPTPVKEFVLVGLAEADVRAALARLAIDGEAVDTGDGWLRVFKVERVKEVKRENQRSLFA